MDPRHWHHIRDFVLDAVELSSSSPGFPYEPRDLALVTSRLALWCWQTAGIPLERPSVFGRHTIERFCQVALPEYSEASRGNLRSQLLRMSDVLLDARSTLRKLAPMKAASPSRPYNDVEIIALNTWVQIQTTEARRRNAAVLLALGLGAGLSASEIGNRRAGDLLVDQRGVTIRVQEGRTRDVPVLHRWEAPLIARREELADDRFVFRENHSFNYDTLISSFVARSPSVGVTPQTQRMRSTWIVHHLTVGSPVKALMAAAGVESLEAFTRYMQFVPDVDSDIRHSASR